MWTLAVQLHRLDCQHPSICDFLHSALQSVRVLFPPFSYNNVAGVSCCNKTHLFVVFFANFRATSAVIVAPVCWNNVLRWPVFVRLSFLWEKALLF